MAEMARNLDEAKNASAMVSDESQLVVFRLADEEFGVDISTVKEIVRVPEITPMPRSPHYVAGICNLRGNVLPVIDTRLRFSMPSGEKSDHTRLLVIDFNGEFVGLVVDAMREVMRMNESLLEPPPPVCQGIDSQFLNGVVKMDNGRRLILMLNLSEVVAINVNTPQSASVTAVQENAVDAARIESVEEEHLVSFNLAGEEFGFDIAKVREILKVPEITTVPNVSDYVKGLFTVRNQLLPILDLRRLLGLSELRGEYFEVIEEAITEQRRIEETAVNSNEQGLQSIALGDPEKTTFGKWLEKYDTSSVEIEVALKNVIKARTEFYEAVQETVKIRGQLKEDNADLQEDTIKPRSRQVLDMLSKLKQTVDEHHGEDQRVMVVEAKGMYVGYMVDSVNEVMRIPRSLIDQTPTMAASRGGELSGIARLNDGERLVMIMDEAVLVSGKASQAINEIQSQMDELGLENMEISETNGNQQILEDEQLVTFGIAEQEYGVQIMQVQEINRIGDITSVPRAPSFVDGVTNLRGNVIPVLNIRSLFGLPAKEIDDRTRVIIVDIGGNKTGLRVDSVNEVMRLPLSEIEKTPEIITADGANRFMTGICKTNNGKRLIVLLDMQRILNENEVALINAIAEQNQAKKAPGGCELDLEPAVAYSPKTEETEGKEEADADE